MEENGVRHLKYKQIVVAIKYEFSNAVV